MCENRVCEHKSHFDGGSGHKFGVTIEVVFSDDIRQVRTPWGIYTVCKSCAETCLKEYVEPDLVAQLTQSLKPVAK